MPVVVGRRDGDDVGVVLVVVIVDVVAGAAIVAGGEDDVDAETARVSPLDHRFGDIEQCLNGVE